MEIGSPAAAGGREFGITWRAVPSVHDVMCLPLFLSNVEGKLLMAEWKEQNKGIIVTPCIYHSFMK
jgi:hypothetical protein